MKNEWTEQDLRQFVESSRPVFQDVSLTQVDEDADRCWQDDGLMVDYELRGGQVDCVLRRCVVADGKVWQLQMTAPLAGNDLPEDRMTPREREMCRDDMNHDFVTGVFNRRYYETEFCTKLDEWTDTLFAIGCADRTRRELEEELKAIYAEMPKECVASVGLMRRVPFTQSIGVAGTREVRCKNWDALYDLCEKRLAAAQTAGGDRIYDGE